MSSRVAKRVLNWCFPRARRNEHIIRRFVHRSGLCKTERSKLKIASYERLRRGTSGTALELYCTGYNDAAFWQLLRMPNFHADFLSQRGWRGQALYAYSNWSHGLWHELAFDKPVVVLHVPLEKAWVSRYNSQWACQHARLPDFQYIIKPEAVVIPVAIIQYDRSKIPEKLQPKVLIKDSDVVHGEFWDKRDLVSMS